MTWNEYEEFGCPLRIPDSECTKRTERVIDFARLRREHTYLDRMLNYPADIFSYDFFADGDCLHRLQFARQTGKFILGGVDPGEA